MSFRTAFPLLPAALLFAVCLIIVSCEKEPLIDDPAAKLAFSADTVLFDTVFTTIGTATRHFKVYNPHKRGIEIATIRLSGGEQSPFRINVDGSPGTTHSNIVIRAGDSIFIFIEATIDPLDGDHPVMVTDSIIFNTNGNVQDVKLVAWGQDVEILDGGIFSSENLTANRPYLVSGQMVVDTGKVLRIEPGVRIHFRTGSGLVVAGTLLVEGTREDPVIFEGARTEQSYRNIPGQWEGIEILPVSQGNRFDHVRIRNGITGVTVRESGYSGDTSIYLANSVIERMTYAGLYARSAVVYSYNTLIINCGHHLVLLEGTGSYTFYHCTFANYWNFSVRRNPALVFISDAAGDGLPADDNSSSLNTISAVFANCVIHGSLNREVDFIPAPSFWPEIIFSYSAVGVEEWFINSHGRIFTNSFAVTEPGFKDRSGYNFRPESGSVLIDRGDPMVARQHPYDFDGNSRIEDDAPDIGAYEWLSDNADQ